MKLFNEGANYVENEAEGAIAAKGRDALIQQLLWLVLFGYFAFGYSRDPSSYSTSNSDDFIKYFPFFDGDSEGFTVDVAARFHLFFLIAFYITLL